MRENGDAYSDYGMGDKALWEFDRVFAAKHMDDEAQSYVMRGRAKAVEGDFTGALEDANHGISLDAENAYNFLNRADIYRMMGDREAALADCQQAMKLDAANPYSYLISAEIEDEMAKTDAALANYQKFYKLRPDEFRHIPPEYLQKISAKDYKTWQKEKAEKEKERMEAWKKKQADKKSSTASAKKAKTTAAKSAKK